VPGSHSSSDLTPVTGFGAKHTLLYDTKELPLCPGLESIPALPLDRSVPGQATVFFVT
jgi:hypothetical protein